MIPDTRGKSAETGLGSGGQRPDRAEGLGNRGRADSEPRTPEESRVNRFPQGHPDDDAIRRASARGRNSRGHS